MRFDSKWLKAYPWHSINIIPSAALIMMYNDEDVPVRAGTVLELVLFGQVFHIDLPINLKRSYMLPTLGPLWSRRRRMWYRAPK